MTIYLKRSTQSVPLRHPKVSDKLILMAAKTFSQQISLFLKVGLFVSCTCIHFKAAAVPYIEGGTSLGSILNGDHFFNESGASVSGKAFVGSLSVYFTTPELLDLCHFDIGLQNRLSLGSTATSQLTLATPNLAARFEFFRFYVGAGGSPFPLGGTTGLGGLKHESGTYSFFFEGGLIWRVVPEFQIVPTFGIEEVKSASGLSPTTIEYGIRFRFPINPHDQSVSKKPVKWDGFRYPFGVMRE